MRAPLSIYVVYHPRSDEGRALANHLHDWFRLKHDDGDGTEAGLPIWFRCRLDGGDVSPPIQLAEAAVQVVIVLVDDVLVADAAWHEPLKRLVAGIEQHPGNLVLPAPIDWSAFRLGFLFGRRNRLPAGAPRAGAGPEDKQAAATRVAARARVLRRAATEAITRQLRKGDAHGAPAPIDVFLSHAKRDGAPIAEAIRDGLADYGQLKAWYDANELPPGYAWDSPMEQAARDGTAALISVVSDAYATRHWCRREVNAARTPRELPGTKRTTAWTVQPAVGVVRHRDLWSRPMAQLAQVPHLGWDDDAARAAAHVEDVVDRLLLETLLVCFYRRYAAEIAAARGDTAPERVALLTWVPDPWSLAFVRAALARRRPKGPWIIAYPGHGLRTAELRELRELLGWMEPSAGAPSFRLISQERLAHLEHADVRLDLRVALSAGGDAPDLEHAGVGPRHIDDLMVRVTRRLLEHGCQIAYGGTLGQYENDLTQALIETARGWDAEADAAPSTVDASQRSPLVNYAPWPSYAGITTRQRAELTGICMFLDVDPADPPTAAAEAKPRTDREHARAAADALTAMRARSSAETDVRIVMAGKIRGWLGWLPGIAEEVAASLGAGQLPLIVGGFGGCAGEIARFLLDPKADLPRSLTLDAARADGPFSLLLTAPGAPAEAEHRFDALHAALRAYRDQLHGHAAWPHAWVPAEDALRLLRTTSPAAAIDAIVGILARHPQVTSVS